MSTRLRASPGTKTAQEHLRALQEGAQPYHSFYGFAAEMAEVLYWFALLIAELVGFVQV